MHPDGIINLDGERFRLAIPVTAAVSFALGWSDLGYTNPKDAVRQLIGFLAIDALEYSEQWRAAGMLRACLLERWPGLKA